MKNTRKYTFDQNVINSAIVLQKQTDELISVIPDDHNDFFPVCILDNDLLIMLTDWEGRQTNQFDTAQESYDILVTLVNENYDAVQDAMQRWA